MNTKETIAIIIGFVLFLFVIAIGIDRNERYECLTWLRESQAYENYYILDWQKEQCDAIRVPIDSPVHSTK